MPQNDWDLPARPPAVEWCHVHRFLGIAAAPALVFLIVNSGRALNPFAVLLACRVLINIGLVIGVSYFIFDIIFCRVLMWLRGAEPAVWRSAALLLFATLACYIGAVAKIG